MLGYGLEKTAQEAGISKNSVLRAEHEEDIRPVTARKIAAALDVPVADLIGESETLKAQPPLPDFAPDEQQPRELQLRGAYGYGEEFPRALALAERLHPGRLVDRGFHLRDYKAALEHAPRAARSGRVKTVFDLRNEAT